MVKDKASSSAADAAEKPSSPTKAAGATGAPRTATRSSPRKKSKSSPPIINTLDAKQNNNDSENAEDRDADATTTLFVQANTPKHANKQQQTPTTTTARDEPPPTTTTASNNSNNHQFLQAQFARQQQQQQRLGAAFASRGGDPSQLQQQQRGGVGGGTLYPVSPGTNFQPYQGRGSLPPDYFEQAGFRGGPQQQFRGTLAPPGAAFVPGRGGGPLPPNFPMQQQYIGTNQAYQTMAGVFSRAVSNSFDRAQQQQQDARMPPQNAAAFFPDHHERKDSLDAGALMDDDSWKQLKQVTSVDEDMMRARLTKSDGHTTPMEAADKKEIASASSSLTNSPVGDVKEADNKPTTTTTAKSSRRTSLDSLSSVASAQEKLQTKDGKPAAAAAVGERLSPGSASAAESLDLMRCHSGSSALLQGFPDGPQRDASLTSVHIPTDEATKRPLEGSTAQPDPKRARQETGKKTSPLPVVCSPPKSPLTNDDKTKQHQQDKPTHSQLQAVTASPGLGSRFQVPTYTRPVDSHSDPRASFPPLPARPSSLSSSSTTTPGVGHENPGLGQSLPSWDIHGQDSFGGASAGGAPIMPNFSFGAAQEYPMLTQSGSNLGLGDNKHGLLQGIGLQGFPPGGGIYPSIAETRNQSFEGGHYHGSFDMGYPPGMPHGGPPGLYKGPFPPHAPSWGSAVSGFQGGHPVGGGGPRVRFADDLRMPPGVMMRNFSMEDGRTSPPGPPPGFMPPPSEFNAPPNQSLGRRVPPVPVYLMSNARPSVNQMDADMIAKQNPGIYGWSKEDDNRLTEVMKKFKNPRSWEPVAKQLGRGKTAKECHERWIRYLKPGVRKGQWTDQEDAIVVEAVTTSAEQPFTRWSDLSQRLPGRVGKQIRDRWVNHLNPHINHLPFTKEDDRLLWEGHKVCGKKWVEISTRFFKSTRSENHIKNRWYSASFKKFITNEYGPDVYDVATKGKSKGKKSAKE